MNAATYAVQVATDPTFATTLYSQFNSAATTMALSSMSNNTTYYWRAGAKNAGGVSGWSTVEQLYYGDSGADLISDAGAAV